MTRNILSRIEAREQAIELYAIEWAKHELDDEHYLVNATKIRKDWDEKYYELEYNIIDKIQYFNTKITAIRSVLGNDNRDLSDILLRNLHADIEPYLLKLYEMLEESNPGNNE